MLLHIRSAHLGILGFPMGGDYTNTGVFLRSLKLCGESRTQQVLSVSKKKIWGNYAFFRDNKASIWKTKTNKQKKPQALPLYFKAFF